MQQLPGASADRLTDGLFDLVTYLMKTAQGDVFRTVMEMDLSMTQVRTLFLAEHAEHPPALHELATELGLSMAATGRSADALVRLGLADRREDTADRRVKRISPTPAGQEIVERLSAARRDSIRRFAETLTEQERAGLAAALAPVLDRPEIRDFTMGPH